MNAFDELEQQLNAMSLEETRTWLKTWCGDDSITPGRSMAYGPDASPARVLQRVMPHLTQQAQNNLALEVGMLLEEFYAHPQVSIDRASNLLRVAEKVFCKGTTSSLVEQIDRFPLWDPFAVQIALSIIIDSKISQPNEFWLKVQQINPARFSGYVFTALLRQDIKVATDLIPQIQSSFLVLMLDLSYGEMSPEQRKELLDGVKEQIPHCRADIGPGLTDWVNRKS